jgi:hypothetical protein
LVEVELPRTVHTITNDYRRWCLYHEEERVYEILSDNEDEGSYNNIEEGMCLNDVKVQRPSSLVKEM